ICFWLWRRNISMWFVAIPALFMLVMPAWALVIQLDGWLFPKPLAGGGTPVAPNYLLAAVAVVMLALEVWMLIEAALMWPRAEGVLGEALPPLPRRGSPAPEPAAGPATAGTSR